MKLFKADMHIHSCLSPCADWQMSPKRIVQKSCDVGLDMIAICDHNTTENIQATIVSGKQKGLKVFPGLEICSREEAHILGIFENMEQASVMQDFVYAHMTGNNQPEVFGDQWVVNEKDEFIRDNDRLLIGATLLDVQKIVGKINEIGGLSIASHVDRPAFGLISQLGFIPPDLELAGIEISHHISPQKARETIAGIEGFPMITSSDAHFLDDIGKVHTCFEIETPALAEIRLALKGEHGRRLVES